MAIIQDKAAISFVLGSIMQEPSLIGGSKDYNLNIEDFPEAFHRSIFWAIETLYFDGVNNIGVPEVDSILQKSPEAYARFNKNKGVDVLNGYLDIANVENFDKYYRTVKKFSAIRQAASDGFDVSAIYNIHETNPNKINEMNLALEAASIDDIVGFFDKKVGKLKDQFLSMYLADDASAGAQIHELIESMQTAPDWGYGLPSKFMNRIYRGARKGKYYIVSAPSGAGKTRIMLSMILNTAIPERYDSNIGRWIPNGNIHPSSMITTELDVEEIQTMCLAWIADVEEDSILEWRLTPEEAERVKRAGDILAQCEQDKSLMITYLPEYDIKDVKTTIEKHVREYKTEYLAWDYIHTNAKLLASLGNGVRNDQNLLLVSTELKNQAKQNHIFIVSGTQITEVQGEEKGVQNIRDAKSIADKADVGFLIFSATKEEVAKTLSPDISDKKGFGQSPMLEEPTHVIHGYKNRRGKWKDAKIFVQFNLGTLKMRDMYATDKNYDREKIAKLEMKTLVEPQTTEPVELKSSLF